MVASHACEIELIHNLVQLWEFVKSDKAQMLFLIAATVRAIFYYLMKSPLPEARELACTLVVVCCFAAAAVILEVRHQGWVKNIVAQCTAGPMLVSK